MGVAGDRLGAGPQAPGGAGRRVVVRSGLRQGPITRLMSPSDLGAYLKPFVFLDIFACHMRWMQQAMPVHPHSGIATVTVFTQGDVRYDDPEAGAGLLGYGGVEWMRAGAGVWHGRELSLGAVPDVQGFQLWIALPPELENGPVDSQYVEAELTPEVGSVRVILGAYEGAQSPVRAPEGIDYLLVRLAPGERWTFAPRPGHEVGWFAVATGSVATAGETAPAERIAVLDRSDAPVAFEAGAQGATFVLGSAAPHAHNLHLGRHSVHTSPAALRLGEEHIERLRLALAASGDRRTANGVTPVFRAAPTG